MNRFGLIRTWLALTWLALLPALTVAGEPQDLKFHSTNVQSTGWKDLAGTKATVVAFLSFDCPMSNGYARPLSEMAKSYSGTGVRFVALCPCDETFEQVAKHAKDFQIGFPVYKDVKLAAADVFQAKMTPEVFVVDSAGRIQYRGAIDDAYSKRLVPNKEVTHTYLKDAIDSVVAGKPVAVAKTETLGCHIVREARRGTSLEVTYHRDVQPILQERCQSCHRPGEVGPFSLMTYKQAVNWADDIKEFTQNRKMPPWKPTGGHEFQGSRRLADQELTTLAKWVDNGCPKGDEKDAPPAKSFVEGWYLGKPDLVLSVPEEFTLGATGKDHFRVFVMPTGLTDDQYVTAVEIRPGNSKIVHHTLNFFDTTGNARKMEAEQLSKRQANPPAKGAVDVGPGYESAMGIGFRFQAGDLLKGKPPVGALGGWAPGILPKYLPDGTGYYLPAGSDFVIQVHYHRNGRVEKDRTQVGLYFAKKPVEKQMLGLIVPGQFKIDQNATGRFARMGYIPAGDSHFVAKGATVVMEDCVVHTCTPHMHLLGKSIKITMTPPGGKTETIIDIGEWDYNWQEQYLLAKPIHVKSGTRFDVEAVFDNSAGNPLNPSSPPIDVPFGEQTTSEMLFGFMGATKANSKTGLKYFILQRPLNGMPRR